MSINEWGFAAEVKSLWDAEFGANPSWSLARCRVEEEVDSGTSHAKRSDLAVRDDADEVVLAGELRLPPDRPRPRRDDGGKQGRLDGGAQDDRAAALRRGRPGPRRASDPAFEADLVRWEVDKQGWPHVAGEWKEEMRRTAALTAYVLGWSRVVERLHHFDLAHIDYDVLGRMFERLIEPHERYRYGQHYTAPAVVDLMLSFGLEKGDGPVADFDCGGGTFLVRAYARLKAHNPQRTRTCSSASAAANISAFATSVATVNLAVRDLVFHANYPRVATRSFFTLEPGEPYMHVPARSGSEDVVVPPLRRWPAICRSAAGSSSSPRESGWTAGTGRAAGMAAEQLPDHRLRRIDGGALVQRGPGGNGRSRGPSADNPVHHFRLVDGLRDQILSVQGDFGESEEFDWHTIPQAELHAPGVEGDEEILEVA